MVSKNKQKWIISLSRKKHRDQEKLFVAEGHKLVTDLLNTDLECRLIAATDEWISANNYERKTAELVTTSGTELKKLSALSTPPPVIAIFRQPVYQLQPEQLSSKLSLFLDDVQDPGNLGTIVRMADWFGIENIICTKGCADIFNHKTVQSTMGAIARVQVHYVETDAFFESISGLDCPVYGTFLDGDNIYETPLNPTGIIIMGNEGKGISPQVESYINSRLYIPNYPPNTNTSESLNVAVATAIICAEFRRRITHIN